MKSRYSALFRTYGPAVVSSVLVVLSFPKIDLSFLAWIALSPLLALLYGKDKKTAFKIGVAFGFVYFFGTTYWIYHSINMYGSIPLVPSLLIVALLSLYLSLYPAFFSVFYAVVLRKTRFPALFLAPVLWTSLEFVRSYMLTGFPWSSLGYSQYRFLTAIQVADITGIYGISFLIVSVNGALADLFLLKRRTRERPLHPLLPTACAFIGLFIVLVATFAYGSYRLHQQRNGSSIRLAVVQGNIEQAHKWDPAYQQSVIKVYEKLSSSSLAEKPDMIIWPESAVPFVFGKTRELTDDVVAFQRSMNSYLLFGSVLFKNGSSNAYSNSALLLDRDGKVSYIYDKIHLVPFGEYVPLRSVLFFVNKLAVGVGDYVPGDSYIKAVTPFGSFGTLICYEIIFPGLVRKFYVKGGDFIVTITNDAWFGKTSGPYQHFTMAVFRAVENRKPVIRAANTGISGFIDSNGEIIRTTKLFERTELMGDIRTDKTLTFYTKYGDIFSYLCIVCSLLLLLKKQRKHP